MSCAGSRTYPKLPKKWSAESEADGLSCERKFLSRLQQNSTLVLYFFAFQTIISRFHKRFVESILKNLFGKEVSDVVVRKIYVCALKRCWNRIQSGNRWFWLWWRLLLQCIQISVSSFTFTVYLFLSNSALTIRHRSITYGTSKAGQGNNQVGRAVWGLDPVSQT